MRIKASLLRGKVRELLQGHADAVIKSIMNENGLSEHQFRRSLFQKHIAARAKAIRQLHADGYSTTNISRVTGFNETTISTHLRNDIKERRRRAVIEREMRA